MRCRGTPIIGWRIYARQTGSIINNFIPATCIQVVGTRWLSTSDRHGQDFENILCGKEPCVMGHETDSPHFCGEHVHIWIEKNIKAKSDEVVPEWREDLPDDLKEVGLNG